MTEKLTPYDPAEDLTSDTAMTIFISEALKTYDAGYIAHALGVSVRAKGMTDIAQKIGLSREELSRLLSKEGDPTLKTILFVMKALEIKLTAEICD